MSEENRIDWNRKYKCKACGLRFRSRELNLGKLDMGVCPRCSKEMVVRRDNKKCCFFIVLLIFLVFILPFIIVFATLRRYSPFY
ncbi:MAG: hypothetical protein ACXADU_13890 [Promethearchaeota archaeon]|jgi:uncharacterized paraquat-inducible protein A